MPSPVHPARLCLTHPAHKRQCPSQWLHPLSGSDHDCQRPMMGFTRPRDVWHLFTSPQVKICARSANKAVGVWGHPAAINFCKKVKATGGHTTQLPQIVKTPRTTVPLPPYCTWHQSVHFVAYDQEPRTKKDLKPVSGTMASNSSLHWMDGQSLEP